MLTLKIIIYVLLFLLPAVQLVRDWKYYDKRTRDYRRVTKLTLLTYILLVLPSAYFLWSDSQEGQKLQGYLTGGDSYCYVNLLPESANSYKIWIINEGEYPIPDVTIRMIDQQILGPSGNQTPESLARATTSFNLDRIPAARAEEHGRANYPISDRLDLIVFIEAQNRSVLEYFSARRINDQWVSAYKILSEDEKETLLERADPSFPRDRTGQILW